jgi:hypothetical protein
MRRLLLGPNVFAEELTPGVTLTPNKLRPCVVCIGISKPLLVVSLYEAHEALATLKNENAEPLLTLHNMFINDFGEQGIWLLPHPDKIKG